MEKKTRQLGVALKAKDDAAKKLTFVITTDTIDRYGEVITPGGWELANYAKNPVVLVDHFYSAEKVIGKAKVSQTENGLEAEVEFAVDESPLAALIYRLYANGFLHAVSVGFIERKGEYRKVDEREFWHILVKELLEFSAVAVPANPEALIRRGLMTPEEAKSIGIKAEAAPDMERIFVETHEVMKSYRKGLERVRKRLGVEPEENEKLTVEKTVEAIIDLLPEASEGLSLSAENQPEPQPVRTIDADAIVRNILAKK